MSLPPEHPLSGRRRAPAIRPSFTLALVYLLAFFVVFSLLLIMPELMGVLRDVAPGPEQERVAQEVARKAFGPRAIYALGLALAAVGLGSYLRVLPGLRR
jgi:hypothetical protein